MSFGFVYFIREEETCRIKIGFSEKNTKGRLKDLKNLVIFKISIKKSHKKNFFIY